MEKTISVSNTINKTLRTAKLIDPFWDRWIVHGLEKNDLGRVREELVTIDQWYQSWDYLAKEKETMARELERQGLFEEAEYVYRQAALYYNLNYWIDPKNSEEKQDWYIKCLEFVHKADQLSNIRTIHRTLLIAESRHSGRIRVPKNPKGCIIIVNPIDSSKEELFKYEMDFVKEGFITVSFDGPGQGETYTLNRVLATRSKWEAFMNLVIEYTKETFPGLPIHLFGTSLAASWVLYGSSHKYVSKAVAVSPAIELKKMNMPSYFMERLDYSCVLEENETPIPKFNDIKYRSPIFIFHGKKDMMIPNAEMYNLFQKISTEKQIVEYEEEGHVCNNKLDEIRRLSLMWFLGKYHLKKGLI
jgi:hypothetical protein